MHPSIYAVQHACPAFPDILGRLFWQARRPSGPEKARQIARAEIRAQGASPLVTALMLGIVDDCLGWPREMRREMRRDEEVAA